LNPYAVITHHPADNKTSQPPNAAAMASVRGEAVGVEFMI
jgi:hypothetical protein